MKMSKVIPLSLVVLIVMSALVLYFIGRGAQDGELAKQTHSGVFNGAVTTPADLDSKSWGAINSGKLDNVAKQVGDLPAEIKKLIPQGGSSKRGVRAPTEGEMINYVQNPKYEDLIRAHGWTPDYLVAEKVASAKAEGKAEGAKGGISKSDLDDRFKAGKSEGLLTAAKQFRDGGGCFMDGSVAIPNSNIVIPQCDPVRIHTTEQAPPTCEWEPYFIVFEPHSKISSIEVLRYPVAGMGDGKVIDPPPDKEQVYEFCVGKGALLEFKARNMNNQYIMEYINGQIEASEDVKVYLVSADETRKRELMVHQMVETDATTKQKFAIWKVRMPSNF